MRISTLVQVWVDMCVYYLTLSCVRARQYRRIGPFIVRGSIHSLKCSEFVWILFDMIYMVARAPSFNWARYEKHPSPFHDLWCGSPGNKVGLFRL
jgi:hypothetical protein